MHVPCVCHCTSTHGLRCANYCDFFDGGQGPPPTHALHGTRMSKRKSVEGLRRAFGILWAEIWAVTVVHHSERSGRNDGGLMAIMPTHDLLVETRNA
eukprot:scaffold263904_cov35-Tisochrysis_lutea.AAC.2